MTSDQSAATWAHLASSRGLCGVGVLRAAPGAQRSARPPAVAAASSVPSGHGAPERAPRLLAPPAAGTTVPCRAPKRACSLEGGRGSHAAGVGGNLRAVLSGDEGGPRGPLRMPGNGCAEPGTSVTRLPSRLFCPRTQVCWLPSVASEPYPAGFGEAEVTLEVGGPVLKASQALAKGKTLPEPAWLQSRCVRPHVVCSTASRPELGTFGAASHPEEAQKVAPALGWTAEGLRNGAPADVHPLCPAAAACLDPLVPRG